MYNWFFTSITPREFEQFMNQFSEEWHPFVFKTFYGSFMKRKLITLFEKDIKNLDANVLPVQDQKDLKDRYISIMNDPKNRVSPLSKYKDSQAIIRRFISHMHLIYTRNTPDARFALLELYKSFFTRTWLEQHGCQTSRWHNTGR